MTKSRKSQSPRVFPGLEWWAAVSAILVAFVALLFVYPLYAPGVSKLANQASPAPSSAPASLLSPDEAQNLHSSRALTRTALVMDPNYWRKLAKGVLSIGLEHPRKEPVRLRDDVLASLRSNLTFQGYMKMAAGTLELNVVPLARAVQTLVELGWNPTWLLLFDEVWEASHRLSEVLETTVHSQQLFDFYVFYIAQGQNGCDVHRDRDAHEADFSSSFRRSDDTPKYSTVCIALTEASPLNSCIYCLPKPVDPYYFINPAGSNVTSGNNPAAAVIQAGLQHVRAMPAIAGDVYSWSHRLLHWGSASSQEATTPRIALSFAVSDSDFEEPYLARSGAIMPTWEERLVLCAFQLVRYHHNVPVRAEVQGVVISIIAKHANLLSGSARLDAAYVQNLPSLFPEEDV